MKLARHCRLLLLWVGCWVGVLAHAAPATPLLDFDGHPAYADRVLVRFKPDIDTSRAMTGKVSAALAKAPADGLRTRLALPATKVQLVQGFSKLPRIAVVRLAPESASVPAGALKAAGQDAATLATLALKARMAELRATGLFESVEPDYVLRASATPSDAAFTDGRLWGLRNTGQAGGVAGADVGAVSAWDVTTGSNAVVVGIIDTGIRYTHQDLAGNMWRNPGETAGNGVDDDNNGYVDDVFGINAITGSGNPFDDNDHGSHVAGTIGATANGGGPHVGVAWNVKLMALKFLGADGSGSTSGAIECINYAIAKGARILNNSWGGGGFSSALAAAIERARQANILFVAAAGNEARDTDASPSYPAGYDIANVISVAALDRRDALAGFSNFGRSTVDLGAPGVDIFSSVASANDSYASFSGTSMATPHVVGVAALLVARYPGIGLAELRQRLLGTTVPVAALAGRSVTGGRVNAPNALRAQADGILELGATTEPSPLAAGQPANVFVSVSDLAPVLGATVSALFGSAANVTLRDNGAAPDRAANDGVYAGTLNVPPTGDSVVLTAQASAPGSRSETRTFTLPVVSRPPNDDFAQRAAIAAGVTRTTGSNRNASSEPQEPVNPPVAGGRSVWWTWTAPTTDTAVITTSGSDFDTTLAVYRGSGFGDLVLLAANDDSGGLQSAVSIAVEAGVTYLIQVDGYAGATGAVVLNHPAAGSVPNAPVIVTQPSDVNVLVGSSFELRVAATGAGLTYQWFKDDQSLAGATESTYGRTVSQLDDSGVYRVEVSNGFGTAVSRNTQVTIERVVVRPNNDDFANAAESTGSGRASATNSEASGEDLEPNHAGVSNPLASIWYRWSAASSGVLTINTFGSNFDTTLAAYTGDALGALTPIASNDDSQGELQSRIEFPVSAGVEYSIAVDGYGNARGNVTLDYTFVPDQGTIPNDDFASRATLDGARVTGSNIGATGEPHEPNHGLLAAPLASVWWEWTAPTSGFVSFDTAGSNFDTVLGIYSGDRLDSLRLLGFSDDANGRTSHVGLGVVAGQRYQVVVDGYAGSQGDIVLNVALSDERPDVYARMSRVTVGRGIYLPTPQIVSLNPRRGTEVVVPLLVINQASEPRFFDLELSGNVAARGMRTRLVGPGGDQTALALQGQLRTPLIAPGGRANYALRVVGDRRFTPVGHRYRAIFIARDVSEPSNRDGIKVLMNMR
ncbi:MAG: S8 family serine peptidase [Gammaproteobacteria bacterium]|nr:S8 family serine peptidase [Gammaproteobacteria bacterium]